jgi:hypothetical protein
MCENERKSQVKLHKNTITAIKGIKIPEDKNMMEKLNYDFE